MGEQESKRQQILLEKSKKQAKLLERIDNIRRLRQAAEQVGCCWAGWWW